MIDELAIKQKENEYKEYIDNHRQNVMKAWTLMKSNNECMDFITKNLNTSLEAVISLVDELVKSHDLSKYKDVEFHPYRKEFYPVTPEEKESNKSSFDAAWEHHYTNNMHHWDWWYKSGNMDKMGLSYVVEMVCDWEAMGYKFGNTSKQWYNDNIDKIHLGETQRRFAEGLMNIICK